MEHLPQPPVCLGEPAWRRALRALGPVLTRVSEPGVGEASTSLARSLGSEVQRIAPGLALHLQAGDRGLVPSIAAHGGCKDPGKRWSPWVVWDQDRVRGGPPGDGSKMGVLPLPCVDGAGSLDVCCVSFLACRPLCHPGSLDASCRRSEEASAHT